MSSASPVPASRFPEREQCPRPGCRGSIAWEVRDCSVCSHSIAPPNVRWAERERGDLDRRYDAAMAALRTDGCEAIAMAYETALAGSMAIFATSLDYAIDLTDLRPHQNYHHGVDGGSRRAAKAPNDVMRRTVDAMLFGSAGTQITMAALSLTPIGLASYGDVHLQFSDDMCEPRASLLSENSFDFVRRHPVDPEQLPPGHRATWQDRARLGLVVAERRLRGVRDADAFPEILIAPGTTRHNDRFMEVHIYGDWTIEAVESAKIRSSALTDDYKRMQASKLGDLLHGRGIPWEIVA